MPTKLTLTGVEFPDGTTQTTRAVAEFASGTRLLFHNATAPTGWTKDTSINDSALRVVSGTPGSGGSAGFASALGTPSVSGSVGLSGEPGSGNLSTSISGNVNIGSTTLSTNQIPSHSHNMNRTTDNGNGNFTSDVPSRFSGVAAQETFSTENTGGSGSHNHNAGHNLSGNISGEPSIGTLSGSLSSASASINVKYQDVIIAQKDQP